MIASMLRWLDDRTGCASCLRAALYEPIPGGARGRYVTGSMLVFAFATQAVTGLFLWMNYSPGSQNAYESVYWIQNELTGGWLLRGVHHFMAQAMVALLPIHFAQVVIAGAYRAPREFNFWTGLVLMLITLGLSLTGYLLPWDQKGFWATRVATNLMGLAPGGDAARKLVVGGSEYGHATLTRFFAVHAGLLPSALVAVLALHLALFRRHGVTAPPPRGRADEYFWPRQVFFDAVACLALLVVVLLLVIRFDVGGLVAGKLDGPHLGADLGPPANPVEDYRAARPEWYFLFLFQFLKKFEANEFLGAIVLPALAVAYLFLMPWIGRSRVGHAVNLGTLAVGLAGALFLTGQAFFDDYRAEWTAYRPERFQADADGRARYNDRFRASRDYLAAVDDGRREYARLRELVAYHGIPTTGVRTLIDDDPELRGPRLFRAKCASCHSQVDAEGRGIAGPEPAEGKEGAVGNEPAGAPNLYRFASRAWLEGLLEPERIVGPHYFGDSAQGREDTDGAYPSGGMVEFVRDTVAAFDDEQQGKLKDVIVGLSAEAGLAYQADADREARQSGAIERGRASFSEIGCADCHEWGDDGIDDGPRLTGYGTVEWLVRMISNPEHESLYDGRNDRMPAFAPESGDGKANLLTLREIELIAGWLRRDAAPLPTE